jgi:A/G-specific adenine glycosylase
MNERRIGDISQERLLDWYAANYRKLPWRETRDPYRILVSEVMLQQTQAERVVPKYHAFLERFPTLAALADAPASEVIRAWAGLGYNRRALNLQRACRTVVERFGGVMPSDPAELASLPGIGPYTAGAIACFAFEQDVGFVDTNIRRVVHRVLAGPELPEPRMTAREIDSAARDLVPPGRGYCWNQALMELGATICRARTAECERCPLQDVCRARPTIQAVLANTPRVARRPEPRFETTSRYFRGQIIDALRDAGPSGLSLAQLGTAIKPDFEVSDAEWIATHVAGLERDGLLVAVDDDLRPERLIAEDAAPYEIAGPNLGQRFRLPE